MRRLSVGYLDSAIEDLKAIYTYLRSRNVSVATARGYVARIRGACRSIGNAPEGGTRRDDLAPDLRTWSFERRAVITYRIENQRVVVRRIYYGGRNFGVLEQRSAFSRDRR